jgi:hypothetical protein
MSVAQLLARQEITDCLMRYCRGVDRADEELIRSAYWPDAHDAHGEWNGPIDAFVGGWLPRQGRREVCQHFVTNLTFVFDDEGADVESYFLSAAKAHDSDDLLLVAGRYCDRFTERGGEWRIQTRLVLQDWLTSTDASSMAGILAATAHRGARDRTDPSYAHPVPTRGTP